MMSSKRWIRMILIMNLIDSMKTMRIINKLTLTTLVKKIMVRMPKRYQTLKMRAMIKLKLIVSSKIKMRFSKFRKNLTTTGKVQKHQNLFKFMEFWGGEKDQFDKILSEYLGKEG